MDLQTQRIVATAALHIKGADNQLLYSTGKDGKPDLDKPCRIHFHSPGTVHAAQAEARQTERALQRLEANGGKPSPAKPEVRRTEAAEDLAAMTSRFENISYGEAQGDDLFRQVYTDPALGFITNQAAAFLGGWHNFKPSSPTS